MVTTAASVCMCFFFCGGGDSHNSSRAEIKCCFNSWCGQSSKDGVLVIIDALKEASRPFCAQSCLVFESSPSPSKQ